MKEYKTVNLRGHHIAVFAGWALNGFVGVNKYLSKEYNPRFADFVVREFRSIRDENKDIRLVRGLDYVCNATDPSCPKLNDDCFRYSDHDKICEVAYNIVPMQVYYVRELLEMARKFRDETGFCDPQTMWDGLDYYAKKKYMSDHSRELSMVRMYEAHDEFL